MQNVVSKEENDSRFEIRLANMLSNNTHVFCDKLSSLIIDNIKESGLRDILFKICALSRAFSISSIFTSQEDCKNLFETSTSESIKQFSSIFVDTMYTLPIESIDWPRNLKMVTMTSEESVIDVKQIQ